MTTEIMLQEIEAKIWYTKKSIPDNNYDPISLSRVLSALGYEYLYYDDSIYMVDDWAEWYRINHMISAICERKLLTDSWSDAMLSDQSPETIKAIWEIVCK